MESFRPWLTHGVRVKSTHNCYNNRFANFCGFMNVSLINISFTCNYCWRSSNLIFAKLWKQIFVAVCGRSKICTGRTLQTNVDPVRKCTSKLEKINTIFSWNSTDFCMASDIVKTSWFLYQQKSPVNDCIFFRPTFSASANSSLLHQVVFQWISLLPVSSLSSSLCRSGFCSLDSLFPEGCIFVICCERLR